MNWLEFFSNLIGHLAWPLVALVALLLFRQTLRESVETLLAKSSGRLALLGLEAEWNALAERLDSEIPPPDDEEPAVQDPMEKAIETEANRLLTLESERARELALEQLRALEEDLRSILIARGEPAWEVKGASFFGLTRIANDQNLLDWSFIQWLRDIGKMGDLLEERMLPVTRERALQFVQFVTVGRRQLKPLMEGPDGAPASEVSTD